MACFGTSFWAFYEFKFSTRAGRCGGAVELKLHAGSGYSIGVQQKIFSGSSLMGLMILPDDFKSGQNVNNNLASSVQQKTQVSKICKNTAGTLVTVTLDSFCPKCLGTVWYMKK